MVTLLTDQCSRREVIDQVLQDMERSNLVFFLITALCLMIFIILCPFCICWYVRKNRILIERQLQRDLEAENQTAQENKKVKQKILRRVIDTYRKLTPGRASGIILGKQDEPPTCSICLDRLYEDSDKVLGVLKSCHHYFCFDCIWQWLEGHKNCPVCRTNIDITTKDIKALTCKVFLKDSTPGAQSRGSFDGEASGSTICDFSRSPSQEPAYYQYERSSENKKENKLKRYRIRGPRGGGHDASDPDHDVQRKWYRPRVRSDLYRSRDPTPASYAFENEDQYSQTSANLRPSSPPPPSIGVYM